jgi:hypothetical protein
MEAKYGGLEVSDAKRQALEDENAKLKKLLAEAMLVLGPPTRMRITGQRTR